MLSKKKQLNIFYVNNVLQLNTHHEHLALNHFFRLFRIVWIFYCQHFEFEELVIFLREVGLDTMQRALRNFNFWSKLELTDRLYLPIFKISI